MAKVLVFVFLLFLFYLILRGSRGLCKRSRSARFFLGNGVGRVRHVGCSKALF